MMIEQRTGLHKSGSAAQRFDSDSDDDGLANCVAFWFGSNPGPSNDGLSERATDGIATLFQFSQNTSTPNTPATESEPLSALFLRAGVIQN